MEYTVKELADLSGVSPRTIRYYDEICLLNPNRINTSGYRIYTTKEVDQLQQILFYKTLGIDLATIAKLKALTRLGEIRVLKKHREDIIAKKKQFDLLLENLNETITSKEKGIKMEDSRKFIGFKKNLIHENEKKYGEEVRNKYGNTTINECNEKLINTTEEKYNNTTELEKKIKKLLKEAVKTNDPSGPLAQKIAGYHKEWLSFYWNSYSKEAHASLAEMYVTDDRFKSYYDDDQPGLAEFLKDAILVYIQN